MKRNLTTVIMACTSAFAYAGGVLTNTNQNAAFLRQISQDAIIDINGLYMNPAGTAFLGNGWHLSASLQNAKQQRDITTTFPLFAYNVNNRSTTHKFEGNADAPVVPSFQLSYNYDKWSVNASFALSGGGGKCEFDRGLGSFEALYASNILASKGQMESLAGMGVRENVVQNLMQAGYDQATASGIAGSGTYNAALAGYSLNAYMKGRQYYFGLQLGATYKVMDNLAVFAGLRGVYATCNYNGFVQDVTAHISYDYAIPAANLQGNGTISSSLNSDLSLNCDQKGFGVTPIIGVDWRINGHWNVAAKYEFNTKMRLKNTTEMNNVGKEQIANGNTTLAQFEDGKKVAANIAGYLAVGAQYSPVKSVRLNAGFHYYADKSATQYNHKEDLIDNNTWEVTGGAEWDICKWFTLSGSWQRTKYGFSDAYMNDLSFLVSSNSMGVGCRVKPTRRFSIDLGYMHTFYQDRTVVAQTPVGYKTDIYHRTNRVLGIGLNMNF